MNRAMVDSAKRYDIFVANPAAKRPRLHEAQMVGIRMFSSADDAGLFGDESQMLLAAMAARLQDRFGVGKV